MKEWQHTHIESFPINQASDRQKVYIRQVEGKNILLYMFETHYSYHLERQKFVSLAELFLLINSKIIQLTQGQWLQIFIAVLIKYKEIQIIEHGNLKPEHIWIRLLKGYYSLTPEITQIEIILSHYGGNLNDNDQLQVICSQLIGLIPLKAQKLRKLMEQTQIHQVDIDVLRKYIDDQKEPYVRLIAKHHALMWNSYEERLIVDQVQQSYQSDRILYIVSTIPPQIKLIHIIVRGLIIDEMVLYNSKADVGKIQKKFEEMMLIIDQGFKNYMAEIESELFKLKVFKDLPTTWTQQQSEQYRAIFEKEFESAIMDSKYFTQVRIYNIQISSFRSIKYEDIQNINKKIFNDKLMNILYSDHKYNYSTQVQNYIQKLKTG